MACRGMHPRLLMLALLLGLCPLQSSPARAADKVLRYTNNEPGNASPIILHADSILTWVDGSRRIVVFKGHVLIDHGTITVRMDQGIALIDMDKMRSTSILHMDVYAEGEVKLEHGAIIQTAPTAILELNTRGEFRLRSHVDKVLQHPEPQNELYLRALKAWSSQSMNTVPGFTRVMGYQDPASPPPQFPPSDGRTAPPPLAPGASAPAPGFSSPQTPAATGPAPVISAGPAIAPPGAVAVVPGGAAPPAPPGPAKAPFRTFNLMPRSLLDNEVQKMTYAGEHVLVITGGIILVVKSADDKSLVDFEADSLIIWTKDDPNKLFSNLRSPGGQSSNEFEIYLSGNVQIRTKDSKGQRELRAEKCYYDVARNVAVATEADVKFVDPRVPDPLHMKAPEIQQLSPELFKGMNATVYSSKLPSDPGLKIVVSEATIEIKDVPRTNIFGITFTNLKTGEPETERQQLFTGKDMVIRLEDLPVFYFPYVHGDVSSPLGPLQSFSFSENHIFGAQFMTSWDLFNLIGVTPPPGMRWRMDLDYMTKRGPAAGTTFDFAGKDFFGLPALVTEHVRAFGIYDTGEDILGGNRGEDDNHPNWRGWFDWQQNVQALPHGFVFQSQVSALSDKNFLEQYFKNTFDNDVNQNTYAYIKQQQDNWAWTAFGDVRIRNWVDETNWLPKLDGYLIGQSFFDIFTYNVQGDIGYAQLKPTNVAPPPFSATTQLDDTGRFDIRQELSAPFTLGPFRVVPYGVLDLAAYNNDLIGDSRGRVIAGGGVRTSIPFSRLYADVESELLNLKGLYHKIVFSTNFYAAHSDVPYWQLPQLDRLNDDASDQSVRDMKLNDTNLLGPAGTLLATSPLYDPQLLAIRRLVDDRIDTMDSIEVLQFDLRQRLQTKRGYPGMEHTVDWMTLDLSASWFPQDNRDNFGEPFGFLEYDWTWNVGDRTALVSSGWFDPIDNGARVFNIGAYFNRNDRTNFYIGFREIDPVDSKAVSSSMTYIFSPKYSMTSIASYDFGIKAEVFSFIFTRMGSDLQTSVGLSYNSLVNSFNFSFQIVPNVAVAQAQRAGMNSLAPTSLGR